MKIQVIFMHVIKRVKYCYNFCLHKFRICDKLYLKVKMRSMKKILMSVLLLVVTFTLTGCFLESDGAKFKLEYESLNGEDRNGKTIRSINIPSDNPFIYKSAEEVADMVEDGETFLVYFGFASCPWCRSVLPTMIDEAKENKIDTIYYVDVLDIRDTLVKEEDSFKKTKDGSEGYNRLIELLSNVLSDYTVDGENAGEKRIYAPNLVSVIDGHADSLLSGISEDQTDGYMELTDKMKSDMEESFGNFFSEYLDRKDSCSSESGC